MFFFCFKVKLAALVESDPKAPFSIATLFPGLLHFTLDPYFIKLSVKQGGIEYHFWVFGMTQPGIEPRSLGPLVNTVLIRPVALFDTYYGLRNPETFRKFEQSIIIY